MVLSRFNSVTTYSLSNKTLKKQAYFACYPVYCERSYILIAMLGISSG